MTEATTNTAPNFTRAEKRRAWNEFKRRERYEKSGFIDFGMKNLIEKVRHNRYVPHIGKKQIGRGR